MAESLFQHFNGGHGNYSNLQDKGTTLSSSGSESDDGSVEDEFVTMVEHGDGQHVVVDNPEGLEITQQNVIELGAEANSSKAKDRRVSKRSKKQKGTDHTTFANLFCDNDKVKSFLTAQIQTAVSTAISGVVVQNLVPGILDNNIEDGSYRNEEHGAGAAIMNTLATGEGLLNSNSACQAVKLPPVPFKEILLTWNCYCPHLRCMFPLQIVIFMTLMSPKIWMALHQFHCCRKYNTNTEEVRLPISRLGY